MRLSVVGQKHPGAAWSALSKQLTLPGQRRLAGLGGVFREISYDTIDEKSGPEAGIHHRTMSQRTAFSFHHQHAPVSLGLPDSTP